MQVRKDVFIPERRTREGISTLTWSCLPRQVFWLADGRRDMQRIAVLLHRDLPLVTEVIWELQKELNTRTKLPSLSLPYNRSAY